MNGSQEPKIGFCIVERFLFQESIYYILWFWVETYHKGSPLWSEHQTRGGMAQSVEHIVHIDGANEGNVSPVGSAEGKCPEFVGVKGRMKPAPKDSGDH